MKEYFRLLRPAQWYKNLVVFLPLIFTLSLFSESSLLKTILGFILLCLISSSGYIINDVVDKEKDKVHPEKKLRPIPSGKISSGAGIAIAVLLFIISLIAAYILSPGFSYLLLALFILTQMYTFKLKHEPFIDILIIAINFVIRAVSGVFLINVALGHWIIICTFFLSLFLATAKRRAESAYLAGNKTEHRKVLAFYTEEVSNALFLISAALLIVSYAFFIFFSEFSILFITFPFVLYLIFLYINFVYSGSAIARNPELIFRNKKAVIALLLYILISIAAIYSGISL